MVILHGNMKQRAVRARNGSGNRGRLPADLRQRAATHEETLLQARVESLPQRNQPNPDIAARNGLQVEVQDLVDQVLAGVATHCWRNPEILAEFKAALPATRPPKK